jgi:hypothetical protein
VDDLTGTAGLVALAAAALALIALAWAIALTVQLRRVRAAQSAVLGVAGAEGRQRDLVAHAAELDAAFRVLHEHVDVVHRHIDDRLGEAEGRLDGAIAYRGLVRFDAYNEMSGRQSASIALLDAHGSGVVVSSIHHRDQARVYAKQVIEGRGDELELSPEEEEAVRVALAGEPVAPRPARGPRTSGRRGRSARRPSSPRRRSSGSARACRSRRSARRSSPCRRARPSARSCRSRARRRARSTRRSTRWPSRRRA